MTLTWKKIEGRAHLTIDGTLSIMDAAQIREEMLQSLEETEGLVLDLSGVDGCDAAGIQLIWSLWKAAEGQGKDFHLETTSESVVETLLRCGIEVDGSWGLGEVDESAQPRHGDQ